MASEQHNDAGEEPRGEDNLRLALTLASIAVVLFLGFLLRGLFW